MTYNIIEIAYISALEEILDEVDSAEDVIEKMIIDNGFSEATGPIIIAFSEAMRIMLHAELITAAEMLRQIMAPVETNQTMQVLNQTLVEYDAMTEELLVDEKDCFENNDSAFHDYEAAKKELLQQRVLARDILHDITPCDDIDTIVEIHGMAQRLDRLMCA